MDPEGTDSVGVKKVHLGRVRNQCQHPVDTSGTNGNILLTRQEPMTASCWHVRNQWQHPVDTSGTNGNILLTRQEPMATSYWHVRNQWQLPIDTSGTNGNFLLTRQEPMAISYWHVSGTSVSRSCRVFSASWETVSCAIRTYSMETVCTSPTLTVCTSPTLSSLIFGVGVPLSPFIWCWVGFVPPLLPYTFISRKELCEVSLWRGVSTVVSIRSVVRRVMTPCIVVVSYVRKQHAASVLWVRWRREARVFVLFRPHRACCLHLLLGRPTFSLPVAVY